MTSLAECLKSHDIDPESIRFGAYCRDGWIPIIDQLIKDLIALGWNKKIEKIKEKFGSLRFDIDFNYCNLTGDKLEQVYQLIGEAEQKSETTCEKCGSPGSLIREIYWLQTLCSKCQK
jgi:alpha-galactosidase